MKRGSREPTLQRRAFLQLAVAGVTATVTGCGSTPRPAAPDGPRRILLASFSRAGENYYNGGRRDLEVGNTKVLAGMIADRLRCDVHEIQAAKPYSDDYDDTVERNVREQQADARPAIANPLRSIARYDTVLLASPIWNVRAPMIMSTFADSHDFSTKTVFPITTYAMSGLGTTAEDYRESCTGARIGAGLAVRGEQVRESGAAIDAWLRRTELLTSQPR